MDPLVRPERCLDALIEQCPFLRERQKAALISSMRATTLQQRREFAWAVMRARAAWLGLGLDWDIQKGDELGKMGVQPAPTDHEASRSVLREELDMNTEWMDGWSLGASGDGDSAARSMAPEHNRRLRTVLRVCQDCSEYDSGLGRCSLLSSAEGRRKLLDQPCNPRDLVRTALIMARFVVGEGKLPQGDETWEIDRKVDEALASLLTGSVDPAKMRYPDARAFLTAWVPGFLLGWGRAARPAAWENRKGFERVDPAPDEFLAGEASKGSVAHGDEDLRLEECRTRLAEAMLDLKAIHPTLEILLRMQVADVDSEGMRTWLRHEYDWTPSTLSKRTADACFRFAVLYERLLRQTSEVLELDGLRILESSDFDRMHKVTLPVFRHDAKEVRERLGLTHGPREVTRRRNAAAAHLLGPLVAPDGLLNRSEFRFKRSTLEAGLGIDKYLAKERKKMGHDDRGRKGGGGDSLFGGSPPEEHPRDEDLVAYGMDSLPRERARQLAIHLMGCNRPRCHRLATAASLVTERALSRWETPSWTGRLRVFFQNLADVVEIDLVFSGAVRQESAEPRRVQVPSTAFPEELDLAPTLVFHGPPGAPLQLVSPTQATGKWTRVDAGKSLESAPGPEPGEHRVLLVVLARELDTDGLAALENAAGVESILDALGVSDVEVRRVVMGSYTVTPDVR